VVLVASDNVDAFGRPFIITRRLPGAPLTHLLRQSTAAQQSQLLVATGDYLRRMHAITFTYPGYLMSAGGPATPPADQDWQHRSWTPGARRRNAVALLATRGSELTPELGDRLHRLFESTAETLESSSFAPRFVHGDCHAHQFFVDVSGAEPKVTGVVDMEVASAGDPIEDLLKFCLEVAAILPAQTRWWQALFDGYGQEPEYTLFRLRMLGCSPEEFACVRPGSAERPWGDVVRHILAADTWLDLFADGW
jgi:aminoglycoside phosphotransferase (APT) family kinase protein